MDTPFIETDCTITSPSGQQFTSGGAYITDDRAVVYLASDPIPKPTYRYKGKPIVTHDDWRAPLTDWHGNQVGLYYVISSWQTPSSYVSTRMYAITATINGRTYYGRTQGPGMVASLKAHKHQPEQEPDCMCPNGHFYKWDGNSDESGCPVCGAEYQD